MAKGLGCISAGLTTIGYLGSLLLFSLIEWSYIVDNWVQFFNPLLHIMVLFSMLVSPFFWLMAVLIALGWATGKLAERVETTGV